MPRKTAFVILVAFLAWPGMLPSSGSGAGGEAAAVERPDKVVSADFNDKIMVVRNLMRLGDNNGASALLEYLYQENPINELVYNLLRECYTKLAFWPKLEALTRRYAQQYPYNYRYQLYLGEVLSKMGRKDDGLSAYKAALGVVEREDTSGVNVVFDRMMADGFEDAIIAAIDSIRIVRADPIAYALHRGKVLESRKQYVPAALEFFSLLGRENELAFQAERRLHGLLGFAESSAQVEQALLAQTETSANVRAFKLLSSFYLGKDDLKKASYFIIKQDSAEGYQGSSLLGFMRSCLERKLYSEAAGIGEYTMNRYTGRPFLSDVQLAYAQALTGLGRYTEAIAAYDSVVVKFPTVTARCEAVYRIGDIYLNHLNDGNRALVYFDSVVQYYQRGVAFLDALVAIPHTYLRMGNLEQAYSHFSELTRRQLAADAMEDVYYHLTLVKFIEKQFDSARVGFQKLIVDYPRGFYVNDALELLVLMDKAGDAPELLNSYSEALLFETRRLPDSALIRLQSIADASKKAIADVALYELIGLSLEKADTTSAMTFVDRLTTEFPESYYVPYGLKTRADVYLTRPGSADQARQIYQGLLEKYPDYPFISEVRKKLRESEAI